MTGNILRRLFCAVLCIGLLCGCTTATESTESPPEPAKTKAAAKREQVSVEVQWIETVAEVPPGDPELNGRLWKGPMPEGVDLRDRIYTDFQGTMNMIDLDSNLVRWGWNGDNIDAGWSYEVGKQTFLQRNVLMKNVQKVTWGFRASLAIDGNQDLWGWGSNFCLLLYDGDSYHPPREPVKLLSGVKDVTAGDFNTAVVRTDGRLQVWGRIDILGDMANYEEPMTLQTGIEKVCSVDTLMYIDQQHRLYYYPDGWGKQHEPKLLDCDIDDVSFLLWNFFLERKTDGSVWIRHFNRKPVLVAEDSKQLAYNGYIAPDGTFWSCRKLEDVEDDPGLSLIVQPMDSACSMIEYGNSGNRGSVHIMKDGEVRVCKEGFG